MLQFDKGGGMQHSETPCQRCSTPALNDAVICELCAGQIRADLRAVPDLLDELTITGSRQDAVSAPGAPVSGSRERPLGFRPGATDARGALVWTVTLWAAARGRQTPATPAVELCRRLEAELPALRFDTATPDHADLLRANVSRAWRVIDRPAQRVYIGPCDECGDELFGRERAHSVYCKRCNLTYDVKDRRDWMRRALMEQYATAAEISSGVGEMFGLQIDRKRINQWHSRKKLWPAFHTPGHAPVFRVGDVIDLATAAVARA